MTVGAMKILDAVLVTGAGATIPAGSRYRPSRTFSAAIAGTGAVTATVLIQVSLDQSVWVTLVTFTLTGTTTDSAGAAAESAWPYYRANVTAITGTGCAATVYMGA